MAAAHSSNRMLKDAIFEANQACMDAMAVHGADAVTNATIGVVLDEEGKLAVLPTMEKVYRSLAMSELAAYAPIVGLPDYLNSVIDLTFADNKPEAHFSAIATAGGTGAIHHAIANYAERGEAVLTSDWFWGNYNVICVETGKRLETFTLFDEGQNFNIADFKNKVDELLKKQDSLLIILNTPAHNPTGFALSESDWDAVLDIVKPYTTSKGKRISILVDIAYIDFAGEKNETRKFMRKFSNLPENLFVMISFSMSKSYTLYGQRTGALVAVSSSKAVVDEFNQVGKYSNRAIWSNVNRGAQALLVKLQQDKTTYAAFEHERQELYNLVQSRANIFVNEAKQCGLNFLPYKGGFFIAVPAKDPAAICNKLHDELVFAVPLKLGIRVAACSVSLDKMKGIAAKMKAAFDKCNKA
ncbi:MAG: aminotransferase class I/II-fold pyridoxal phosphate-dependent enzyme [Selenomonadaceae bacterium]|nr:aminotransferase class I/II-fold pyridoxal phosphate-dependent enzyme [Selenomonadaceae bacterium]MBR1858251.1 aminotransferase class I/II-fold pyridoxal phosphate-dependent enzyme [Selenomonadaceae bacterium]